MKTDLLIVGQGIAGTMAAYFAERCGWSVHIIDNPASHTASAVAAGIINPITGRHYVKSWLFDTLLPFARQTYADLENLLQIPIFEPLNIPRALFSQREEVDFYARSGQASYADYMEQDADGRLFEGFIQMPHAFGEMRQSGKANLPLLIQTYRNYLSKKGCFSSQVFDYQAVRIASDKVFYKDFETKKILFCEGIGAKNNPFFNYLPFKGTKGEVLLVRIPNFPSEKILKHRLFFVPLGDELFWVGSTNDNQYQDALPTEQGRSYLTQKMNAILTVPYSVEVHLSAIRPTVEDRRPFLGRHFEFHNLLIFNGLGSKGATLAPFFANQLMRYLTDGEPILPEVDIQRFAKNK